MDEQIQNFIDSKHIGIVGVSRSKMKFGSTAYRTLKQKDYHLYPVNPALETIDGERCYRDVGELPGEVDALLITVAPDKAEKIIESLGNGRFRRVWFQRGADFSSAAQKARDKGMEVVTGKCILMYAAPVQSIHSFHRFVVKLFGKL